MIHISYLKSEFWEIKIVNTLNPVLYSHIFNKETKMNANVTADGQKNLHVIIYIHISLSQCLKRQQIN